MFNINRQPSSVQPGCGAVPSYSAKKTANVPSPDNPFQRCNFCQRLLPGFPNQDDGTNARAENGQQLIIFSCGHVSCQGCLAKQNFPKSADDRNVHCSTQFACSACKEVVHHTVLPTILNSPLFKCGTSGCHSEPADVKFFCSACSEWKCACCRTLHDIHYPYHAGHMKSLEEKVAGDCLPDPNRVLVCHRHAVPGSSRCSGCGDLTCESCSFNYVDKDQDKVLVAHNKMNLTEYNETLEKALLEVNQKEDQIASVVADIQNRVTDFVNQTDILKNEICIHFYSIINAALGRLFQILNSIKNEELHVHKKLEEAQRHCTNAGRRLSVASQLHEKSRDRSGLSNTSKDILRTEAYSIFRPIYSDYNKAKTILDDLKKSPPSLEVNNNNTEDILNTITTWGSLSSSMRDSKTSTIVIPRYNIKQPWDNRTQPPDVFADKTGTSPAAPLIDLNLEPRAGQPLLYLSLFTDIWDKQVIQTVPAKEFVMLQLRKQNANNGNIWNVRSGGSARVPAKNAVPSIQPHPFHQIIRARQQVRSSQPGTSSRSASNEGNDRILKNEPTTPVVDEAAPPQIAAFNPSVRRPPQRNAACKQPVRPIPPPLIAPPHMVRTNLVHRSDVRCSLENGPSTSSTHHTVADSEFSQASRSSSSTPSRVSLPREDGNPAAGESNPFLKSRSKPKVSSKANDVQEPGCTPVAGRSEDVPKQHPSKIPPTEPAMRPCPKLKIKLGGQTTVLVPQNDSGSPPKQVITHDTGDRELDSADGTCKYCWVCNDNRKIDREKGICSDCPRVYHQSCHIPPITCSWDDLPENWRCCMCESLSGSIPSPGNDTIDHSNLKRCGKVLLSCYENQKDAAWFAQPVLDEDGYAEVIKHPMDLGTVGRGLLPQGANRFNTVSQFITNMNLIFKNCATFNEGDSEVARAGKKVWKLYQRAVKRYLPNHMKEVWLYFSMYKGPETTTKRKAGDERNDYPKKKFAPDLAKLNRVSRQKEERPSKNDVKKRASAQEKTGEGA